MNALVLIRTDGKKPINLPLANKAAERISAQPKSWKPTDGITHQGAVLTDVRLDDWNKLQAMLKSGAVHVVHDMGDATDPTDALNYVFLRINPIA